MTRRTAAELLRLTTVLEELFLCIRRGDDESDVGSLSMPHLQDLAVCVDTCVDAILEPFDCPNLTHLQISSSIGWTADTYDIIKRQYNLHGLEVVIFSDGCSLPLSTILKDALELRKLEVPENASLDDEAITGIATGELGRHLKALGICGRRDIDKILGMVEQRQRTVAKIVQKGHSSWKDQISLLTKVELDGAEDWEKYAKRINVLMKAGINVEFKEEREED